MQVGTLEEDFEWLCYEYGILVTIVENLGCEFGDFVTLTTMNIT